MAITSDLWSNGVVELLAMSCGTAVYKDGSSLRVVHVGGNGLSVARFVAALLTLFGVVGGVAIGATASITGGLVGLAFGVSAGLLFRHLGRVRARKLSRSPAELPRYVTIDCDANEVRDREGAVLGSLDSAYLSLVFQATSSAKALALTVGGTKMVIARGNPFAGDVAMVADVLVKHGVKAP
jgi:hypothetical protein